MPVRLECGSDWDIFGDVTAFDIIVYNRGTGQDLSYWLAETPMTWGGNPIPGLPVWMRKAFGEPGFGIVGAGGHRRIHMETDRAFPSDLPISMCRDYDNNTVYDYQSYYGAAYVVSNAGAEIRDSVQYDYDNAFSWGQVWMRKAGHLLCRPPQYDPLGSTYGFWINPYNQAIYVIDADLAKLAAGGSHITVYDYDFKPVLPNYQLFPRASTGADGDIMTVKMSYENAVHIPNLNYVDHRQTICCGYIKANVLDTWHGGLTYPYSYFTADVQQWRFSFVLEKVSGTWQYISGEMWTSWSPPYDYKVIP